MTGLVWRFLRVQVLNEVQYRANFLVRLLNSALSLVTGVAVLALVFGQVDRLNGWSSQQLLVVMGVFTMMNGFVQMVVMPAALKLLTDIQDGDLDHVLAKPVDAQLVVSVRVVQLWQGLDLLTGAGVVAVAVWLGGGVDPLDLLAFAVSLVLGAVLVHSFLMIITTTAFWFVRLDNVAELFSGIYQAARWPVGIYPGWLRAGLTFVVPIGLAVTVPAEALTSRLTLQTLATQAALALALALTSRALWRAGLRRYSGASA
ncbi:ABC-2 family transporter protein [Umezawaea sp. Da 62-37]|uniref:ABC transporter permease n=1 Tax=Umezawaea sp. Da 62-37 TaxID=3075927 RepID=UPI0028F73E78|nr:ABC-2 family transporter protein [Umezawaea sp. Da 62-37]WNV87680.1 ABC-2 family transporter protein [Umezawaea sp. Da 62-37]